MEMATVKTSRKYKIKNAMFQKKTRKRWTWKSLNGITKTEIDYILTNTPYIVTNITIINQGNIGSDHRLVVGKKKLNGELEKYNIITKGQERVDYNNRIKEDRMPTRIEKPNARL